MRGLLRNWKTFWAGRVARRNRGWLAESLGQRSLRLEPLENRRLLAAQVVYGESATLLAEPGAEFRFDVTYETDPIGILATGLGLELHFNSSLMADPTWENVIPAGITLQTVQDELTDSDGDPTTDRVLNTLWAEAGASTWPADPQPARLYTAIFQADAAATGSTFLRFTATDIGLDTFESTPIEVHFNLAPTADAGGPYTVDEGSDLTLDGTASSDPNLPVGDTLLYEWDFDGNGTFGEIGTPLGDEVGVSPILLGANLDGPAMFSVALRVTDSLGVTDLSTATVQVANLPPDVTGLSATATDEGGTSTLGGTISDASAADAFTVTIDWGDGTTPEVLGYATGTTDFSRGHVYLDDPTGLPDDYTISVIVNDGDDTSPVRTTIATVDNVAPSLTSLSLSSAANEGDTSTLSGTILEPGIEDALTVDINWGDGTGIQRLNLAPGTTSFSPTHTWADNPTAPATLFAISVTVTDDDGGTDSDSTTITVNNVAPILSNLSATSVTEGDESTLSGTITDVGYLDSFTVSVNWGDGSAVENFALPAGTTDFTRPHVYLDDPSGAPVTYPISVTVTDDDGGSDSGSMGSTVVTVTNEAPSLSNVVATATTEGTATTLSGTITDVGILDTFTVSVSWGDSTPSEQFTLPAGTTDFTRPHVYLDDPNGTPDTYSIVVAIFDDDGGSDGDSTTVLVDNVAPTLSGVSADGVTEDGTATLAATITDPGTLDTFTVEINWGDGSAIETLDYPAGTTTINPTHQYLDDPTGTPDTYPISVTVTDDDDGTDTAQTTIDVTNAAPVLSDLSATPSPLTEGQTATLSGTITDPGTLDTFQVSITWGDGSPTEHFDYPAGTTAFSKQHTYADDPIGTPDEYTVTVTVLDKDGGTDLSEIDVTVDNEPPTVDAGAATAFILQGETFTQAGSFTDPGDDTWTATVDYDNGLGARTLTLTGETFQLDSTYTNPGTYTVTVAVTDDDGGVGNDTVIVTVDNVAPVVDAGDDATLTEGSTFSRNGSFIDPGTDTWTGTVDYGEGAGPVTLTLEEDKTFELDHLYADNGSYTVIVTVDDGTGTATSSGSDTFVLTIDNATPVLSNVAATTTDEGSASTLSGTITDPGTLDTFAVDVDWGDGTTVETFNYPAGTTSFSETHVYVDDPDGTPDEYDVTVTVTDKDAASDEVTLAVGVNNVAPSFELGANVGMNEGDTLSADYVVSDPGVDDVMVVTVDYGDGVLVTLPVDQDGNFSLDRVYPQDGTFTVTVTANDGDGPATVDSFDVTVGNVAPSVVVGADETIDEGDTLDREGSFTDVGVDDEWTATVNYGDTATVEDLTLETDGTFLLDHVYADDGVFTVTVTVSDGVASTPATFEVTVDNVLPSVSAGVDVGIAQGETFTQSGSFADPGDDTWTATVDYDDGAGAEELTLTGKTFELDHIYANEGAYTVTIVVTDDDGGIGSDTVIVAVGNVAPVVDAGDNETLIEGSTFDRDGSFIDPGTGSWTATVDYGEGAGPVTLTLEEDKTFELDHLYADNGDYTVIVTVDDGSGSGTSSGSDTFVLTVNNATPVLSNVVATTTDEGSASTLTGTITDPGTLDTFSLRIDWADGTPAETFNYPAGTTSFSETHVYADDPIGTPDIRTIDLRVTDSDTAYSFGSVPVTINNVVPSFELGPDVAINEGDTLTADYDLVDPGAADNVTLTIDYDDGVPATVPLWTNRSFSLYHVYPQDGTYTVTVTANDGDGPAAVDSFDVTVGNVAPSVVVGADETIDEGDTLDREGSFTDVGVDDEWTATVNYGDTATVEDLTLETDGTFLLDHVYADDGVFTVTVTVSDEVASTPATFQMTVDNVLPSVNAGADVGIAQGATFTRSGSFTDPGDDSWTATVDYDDGGGVEPLTLAGKTFELDHTYANEGAYTVTVVVTDVDGGSGIGSDTVTVAVGNVAPTVDAGDDATLPEGSTFSRAGSFIDPGTGAWTATVDYGEGAGPVTLTLEEDKTFELDHLYADNGDYTVTVAVDDGSGSGTSSGSDAFVLTVDNATPVLSNVAATTTDEGSASTLSGTITDPGTLDTFAVDVDWGDGTTVETFNYPAGTTSFSETHVYSDDPDGTPDEFTVTVTVTDKDAASDEVTLAVGVNNVAPSFELGANVGMNEGDTLSADYVVSDPGVDDVMVVTVDYGDGVLVTLPVDQDGNFSLDRVYPQDGTFTVTVTANDGDGPATVDSFDVTVGNVAPSVVVGADETIDEGDTLDREGSFTDVGVDDEWTATVNYGDTATVEDLTLETDGTFLLDHVYADDGVFTVTVTVSDGVASTPATFEVTVDNVLPSVSAGVDVGIAQGETFTQSGSFADPGDDTWTATVDYDDGAGAEELTLTGKTFELDHIYANEGAYTVTVVVSEVDSGGGSGSDTVLVVVGNIAPVVNAGDDETSTEGSSFSRDGSFLDLGTGNWTATVDYGEGAGAEGLTLEADKTFTLDHVHADNGEYTVTVTVDDGSGTGASTGSDTFVLTVDNATPVLSNVAATTTDEGSASTLSGTITDPGALDTFTVDVDWGDGTMAETFDYPAGTTSFSETHVYLDDPDGTPDEYDVTVTVTDKDAASDEVTIAVGVNNVAPSFELGADVGLNEGDTLSADYVVSDPGADTVAVTVDYGDGVPVTLSVDQDGNFSLDRDYPQDGTFTVTVTADDGDGPATVDSFELSVTNVAPVVSLPEDVAIDFDEPLAEVGSFVDPGSDAWTATVDYGDGTGVSSLSLADKSFSLDHVYVELGVYQVTVTVSDDDTSGSATMEVTVQDKFQPHDALDLGVVDYHELPDSSLFGGDLWYMIEATRAGLLTVQADSAGAVDVSFLDASLEAVVPVTATAGRQDIAVDHAGEVFYARVAGDPGLIDLRVVNLVVPATGEVTVHGTSGDDVFAFDPVSPRSVTADGVEYAFDTSAIALVTFVDSLGGDDTLTLHDTPGPEQLIASADRTTLTGVGFTVVGEGFDHVVIDGARGGGDVAWLYDTQGNDTFTSRPDRGVLAGKGYSITVDSYDQIRTFATAGGHDTAVMTGSDGADRVVSRKSRSKVVGSGFWHRVSGFDEVQIDGGEGQDWGKLVDSAHVERLRAGPDSASLVGGGLQRTLIGVEEVVARSRLGERDIALLSGSPGDDQLTMSPRRAVFSGSEFKITVKGFHAIKANGSSGGHDVAEMRDSGGNDTFQGTSVRSRFFGSTFLNVARHFDVVHAYSSVGGNDHAHLVVESASDRVTRTCNSIEVIGAGYELLALGFESDYIGFRGRGDADNAIGTRAVDELLASGALDE